MPARKSIAENVGELSPRDLDSVSGGTPDQTTPPPSPAPLPMPYPIVGTPTDPLPEPKPILRG